MKLYKRLLSLLLVCFLCFGLFSVNAYAVDVGENLVDSTLTNWDLIYESSTNFKCSVTRFTNFPTNFYTVYFRDGLENIPVGSYACLSKVTNLTLGDVYNFDFSLYFNDLNIDCFDYYTLSVGFAYLDNEGDIVFIDDNSFITISNETHSFSNGYYDFNLSFKNNSLTDVYLCFYLVCHQSYFSNTSTYSYVPIFGNVSLTRQPSETENKLDGILGWLEDIKDSITGLGDNLTSVWQNITNSLTNLGDRISGFFTELTNTISTKFNELTTNFSNYITNLGDRIKQFFDELPEKIFTFEIDASEIESDISFKDFMENLSFNGSLEVTDYGDYFYFFYPEQQWTMVDLTATSNSFDIKSETDYEFTFDVTSLELNRYAVIDVYIKSSYNSRSVRIDSNGTYTLSLPSSPVPDKAYIYINCYSGSRVTAYWNMRNFNFVPVGSDSGESITIRVTWFEYLIGKFNKWFNTVIDSVKGFFIKLVDDIKGLFLPSDGYFEDLSNRFDLLIEQRFGALVTITDYLVEFFSSFNADVTKEYFDVPIININLMGYNFPIGGWQVRFVPQFNGVELLTNACKFISSVLATFAFFDGLKKKYHEVFGGGE